MKATLLGPGSNNTRRAAARLATLALAALGAGACGPAETQTVAAGGTTSVSAPTVVVVQGGGSSASSSGGAADPSAPAASSSVASANASGGGAQTVPRGRLGHYSSENGMVGFVFDRTSNPPLVRVDGSNAVVPLTPRPGPLSSTEFTNDQQHIWIRVGEYGEVLFDGPEQTEGINVWRDADAQPLR